MKKNVYGFIIFTLLLAFYIFISALFYVSQVSSNLAQSVFRLHIIANSNSIEDQNLKYKIRDELINYMDSVCSKSYSKEETIKYISTHLKDFENIANQAIIKNGFNYTANAEIGNFEFPTKIYGDIRLPSGNYDALEIKIGKASGRNWWCVLYPSLCFVDVTSGVVPDESKEELKNSLNEEEYALISNTENPELNFKFKLVEFFKNNTMFVARN